MRVASALLIVACVAGCNEPETRTYKFHALAGVSMGAIGTSLVAGPGRNHEKLDAVGMLGGPMDVGYFLGSLERNQVGGFCPLARLEALASTDPAKLDDPTALDCTVPSTPYLYEHAQNFNRWQYTDNGGNFDRDSYLDIFFDLALALGNPFYENPDSPLFPAKPITRDNFKQALCAQPVVLKKFHNKEYNPAGIHDVITFCDGEEPIYYCDDDALTPYDACSGKTPEAFCQERGAKKKTAGKRSSENPALFYARKGLFEPCHAHTQPVAIGLAVDLNGNGRRDFHEPVIANGHERFSDVGVDRCENAREDGKGGCTASGASGDSNKDDFTPDNPLGTEFNGLHDPGEPFEDLGLDGVAATGDKGEGNGKYDDGANRAHWLAQDFRRNYLAWTDAERRALDIYADGGVRDVFNLGLSADFVTSITRHLEPEASFRYTSFLQLPDGAQNDWAIGYFNPLQADYARMGRNTFVRYGNEQATEEERHAGDGDHVGSAQQIIWRFGTFVKWMSERWTPALGPSARIGGAGRREEKTYFSAALEAPRNYSIALPPGYDENPDKRYPVLFLLHGYGMEAGNMSDLNLVIDNFTLSGDVRETIIVYPSGRCCYVKPDGRKDCRENDDDGSELERKPGYVRECRKGNFYVNRRGFVPGDDTRYGDALFELMDEVDRQYRVLAPQTVELGADGD